MFNWSADGKIVHKSFGITLFKIENAELVSDAYDKLPQADKVRLREMQDQEEKRRKDQERYEIKQKNLIEQLKRDDEERLKKQDQFYIEKLKNLTLEHEKILKLEKELNLNLNLTAILQPRNGTNLDIE